MIVSVKDYVGAVRAEKEKTMELLISGYGPAGRKNLVKCDETGKVVWADTVESPALSAPRATFCLPVRKTMIMPCSQPMSGTATAIE